MPILGLEPHRMYMFDAYNYFEPRRTYTLDAYI